MNDFAPLSANHIPQPGLTKAGLRDLVDAGAQIERQWKSRQSEQVCVGSQNEQNKKLKEKKPK